MAARQPELDGPVILAQSAASDQIGESSGVEAATHWNDGYQV